MFAASTNTGQVIHTHTHTRTEKERMRTKPEKKEILRLLGVSLFSENNDSLNVLLVNLCIHETE